jgi:hypothetical protein
MTQRVVVARAALEDVALEHDRLVPLAHNRAVSDATTGAAIQLQPLPGNRRGTRSLAIRGRDVERNRIATAIPRAGPVFEQRVHAPELELIVTQPILQLLARGGDLTLKCRVLGKLLF